MITNLGGKIGTALVSVLIDWLSDTLVFPTIGVAEISAAEESRGDRGNRFE